MTTQALSLGNLEAPSESKRGFHPIRSLKEGLRRRREHAEAESMLSSCIEKGSGGGSDFKGALERFERIGQRRQEKVLRNVAARLYGYSSCEFASERNSSEITTLMVFAADAAASMRKKEDGTPSFGDQSLLMRRLKGILSQEEGYAPLNPVHANAKLAAAVALWEFGQRELKDLSQYIRLPLVGNFVVAKLLEDAVRNPSEGSGRDILRSNLDTGLALTIAFNPNPAKFDFVASMMLDNDPSVVAHALEAAVYFDPLPEGYLDIAAEAAARSEFLSDKVSAFIAVVRMRPLIEAAGEIQFAAAAQVLGLYREGAGHLGPMLVAIGLEMKDVYMYPGGLTEGERANQQAMAASIMNQLHASGIPVPGVDFGDGRR